MRKRTVTSSSLQLVMRPWLAAGFVAVGLLAGCGRPAPAGENEVGAAPDPAADGVTEPSIAAGDTSASDETTGSTAAGDVMTSSTEAGQVAQSEGQIQSVAPVIITAANLSGVVDQSPDRAGVRVTSSNPVVAVAPVIETTTTTAPSTVPGVHVVASGDTLSVIAETYGVSIQAIAEANGLENLDSLKLGQELIIPGG